MNTSAMVYNTLGVSLFGLLAIIVVAVIVRRTVGFETVAGFASVGGTATVSMVLALASGPLSQASLNGAATDLNPDMTDIGTAINDGKDWIGMVGDQAKRCTASTPDRHAWLPIQSVDVRIDCDKVVAP